VKALLSGGDRPSWLDYAVSPIVLLLAVLGGFQAFPVGYSAHEPFAEYVANPGVRLIGVIALVADLALVGSVVVWRVRTALVAKAQLTIVLAATTAALLPWVELWWGSVSYYGEVRDKQGLPWSVVHFGPTGTFLFATYLILRIKLPAPGVLTRYVERIGLIVALWYLQPALLRALEGPWLLYQS
jgi:fumarate reductase subunit C